MADQLDAPVWAREESLPPKPATGAFSLYGYIDTKGKESAAESIDDLVDKVSKSRIGVDMVWTPEVEHLQAPEEVKELRDILWKRQSHWAQGDIADGKRMSLVFGVVMLWYLYAGYVNSKGDLMSVLLSPSLGISGILFLIFGLLPLYEGQKILRKGKPKSENDWQIEVEESMFDSWLSRQRVPATFFLMGIMIAAGLIQLFLEKGLDWSVLSVTRAGLLKYGDVEWWRFFTAPYLHGNLLHWVMNAGGILYLGRRVELLARWPHVIIVMFGSAWVGGLATSYFVSKPSVGASGGIMGLLGFLLVFETMHTRLVPKSSRRRLMAGVIMTVLMGVLGFQFIDNAAHAGGLLAGMAYAVLGFPTSKSPQRPSILKQDRWIAFAMAGVILGGLYFVYSKLIV